MCQSLEILNAFNTFSLKHVFGKTKTFFKKLEYCFSIKSAAHENLTFLYKTSQSKACVKTNAMGSIKLTYHKEQKTH